MSTTCILHLFEGYGIELEYMIVDKETLSVLPVTDKILHHIAGEYVSDAEMGELEWSNELVLHVIELKTNGPAKSILGLEQNFHNHVQHINQILAPMHGKLMPTAMHPWMDPNSEMKLWEHDYSAVYEAYNRIFNCSGHGWANLQSTHINLPFADDEEFGKLHAAIRLVLPILPALAAASPIAESQVKDFADYRLEVYRNNQAKIPQIAGQVIPEQVFTKAEYQAGIFDPLYEAIKPHDPENIMQEEWLNSRGAIARFDRNTIEIRVIDIQECPKADIAIAVFAVEVIKALISEKWSTCEAQKTLHETPLADIFLRTVKHGEETTINNAAFLKLFGIEAEEMLAKDLWKHLFSEVINTEEFAHYHNALNVILYSGTLSARIKKALGTTTPTRQQLHFVYEELCNCLNENRQFLPDA